MEFFIVLLLAWFGLGILGWIIRGISALFSSPKPSIDEEKLYSALKSVSLSSFDCNTVSIQSAQINDDTDIYVVKNDPNKQRMLTEKQSLLRTGSDTFKFDDDLF